MQKKADAAMKSDAKKVDADAKKVEKEAKAKKSDKISESKAEQSPRIVRPVRRSTLKPLDQKQQETLENNVFTQLNKTYKNTRSVPRLWCYVLERQSIACGFEI